MEVEEKPWLNASFEDLMTRAFRCNNCCNGGYMSYHCPLCPTSNFKPTKNCKVVRHLGVHWKTRIESDRDGLFSVICHLRHENFANDRGHFHCLYCPYINVKRKRLAAHIQLCPSRQKQMSNIVGETMGKADSITKERVLGDHVYAAPLAQSPTSSKKVTCDVCGKRVHKRWLTSHKKLHNERKEINSKRHHSTVIIDPQNGIYTSSKNLQGPQHPVHVVKKIHGDQQQVNCEDTNCIDTMNTASRGSNFAYECVHLRSIPYAVPGEEYHLSEQILEQMQNNGLITQERRDQSLLLKQKSMEKNVPFVVRIPIAEGTSDRYIFLSVFTGVSSHWGKFERTVVTFDTKKLVTLCKCSREGTSCLHKIIGKWFIAQCHPTYFSSSSHSDEESLQQSEHSHGESMESPPQHNESRGESLEDVDYEFVASRDLRLEPSADRCLECGGGLMKHVVNERAKIITMRSVRRGIPVLRQRCIGCGKVVRFSGCDKGLHNFHDSLFLGADVCIFIRSGLQNHVAIGRSVAVLEDMLEEHIACHEVERAYLHFEASYAHDYNFSCVLCGFHPVVIIWDTFRKAGFRFAVSDLRIPEDCNDTVNARGFWKDVENAVLSGKPNTTKGDPVIPPSYSYWAPWIGENTRISDDVYNTEVKKCAKFDDAEEIDEPMPEELLTNLLLNEKVTNIRRICRNMGLRGEGSAMDMILKMRERSITKGVFDKAYEKVFGCTGGWAVGCCPHGIIYSIKNLLRSESPRDYFDLERSFKHRPNVSICDIAHLLARHGNKKIPGFYQPFDGRLAEVTEETLSSIEAGTASFSLPFLNCTKKIEDDITFDHTTNPVTRSSHHLVLFDWFHEKNCKSRNEILRRSSLLRELAGIINTQVVEQVFSSSKRDIYYLNNMSPGNHLFIFRLVAHLRNEKKNKVLRRKQEKHFGKSISFNKFGQLTQLFGRKEIDTNEDLEEHTEIDMQDSTVPLEK